MLHIGCTILHLMKQQMNDVFGKCNNPHYHGHNYELIVKLIGEPDKETGYVMDLKVLSDIIKENVIKTIRS